MANPPFRDRIPLSGMTMPFLTPVEIANNSQSLWYCPANGLYVGWISDYTCKSPYDSFSPVTLDTLKKEFCLFIPSDPFELKFKGAVMFSELWFELPLTIPVPYDVLNSPTEGFCKYSNQGYESFLLRDSSRVSRPDNFAYDRGVLLYNPAKYVKHINHRIYSTIER